jgi:ketosteroid isomerase-like protein
MSQENVDIVRRVLAKFQSGNFWVPEFFDPAVHIRWLDSVFTQSETVGLQEMSDFMKTWLETWDDLSLIPERVVDAGDQVVVISAWHAQSKTSALHTEWRHGAVWTLRDGRVASVIAYTDPEEALKAAGVQD